MNLRISEHERMILKEEAKKALRAYLGTGMGGFFQKGMDRVRALGIETNGVEDERDGIEAIILQLELFPN